MAISSLAPNRVKPTDEQLQAIALFGEGESLAIEAGAGSGKTTTLKMLGKYNKGKGQYIAFNKAIVEDAKSSMPSHIRCSTAHGLAFGAVGRDYSTRLNAPRVRAVDAARYLNLRPITLSVNGGRKVLSISRLGAITNRTIARFCQSADPELTRRHVPYIDGIDLPGKWDNNNHVAEAILPAAVRAWNDLQGKTGFLQFKHEHYLKIWQLSGPKINAEYILFDEAQDANPVILDIVRQQKHAQLIFVGDSQQAIYGFTGAINALADVPVDRRTFLTQSFRFGQPIADVANDLLEILQADLRLKGFDQITSTVGRISDPDVILTRTNARAVEHCIDYQRRGRKVALAGGGQDILFFAEGVKSLIEQKWTSHPQLACFDSWEEVQDYVRMEKDDASDLNLNVGLIEKFGVQIIIDALKRTEQYEGNADIILSTAHKSKGREWDRVQLADDFNVDKPSVEELRLLYVASTRGSLELDNFHVDLGSLRSASLAI